MTNERDLSILLGAFLAEGSESVADRVVDAALNEIDHTPQRPAARLPWRFPDMSNGLKLALGGATLVVVLVGGVIFMGSRSTDIGGPGSTASPARPTPSATADAVRDPAALAGSWQVCTTAAELEAAGAATTEAADNAGCTTIAFGPMDTGLRGEFAETGSAAGTNEPGTYVVDGDRLSVERSNGETFAFTWSVVDGMLTLAPVGGDAGISPVPWTAKPWARPSAIDGIWSPIASTLHVYSGRIPVGWARTPATEPWTAGGWGGADTPVSSTTDVFTAPDGASIIVASQPVPEGTLEADWLEGYVEGTGGLPAECWPTLSEWEMVDVDRHTAWIHGGLPTCGFTEAVAIGDGPSKQGVRGYVIIGKATSGSTVFDRATFDAFLDSFRFDPAAASEPPATARP